jgi:dephospho-CoA kinase
MLKIGITGGIGSGKTTICKVFELQGVPVFYADLQARDLMTTDSLLIENLKQAFGTNIYPSGVLDRSKLASIVFGDKAKLELLNSLVHPAVFSAFDCWVGRQTAPYIVKEAALLFESGSYKRCDIRVLVKSPHALKMQRIMKRDGVAEDEVLKRMSRQWQDDDKEKLSDYVVTNDERQLVIPQVLSLHQNFLSKQG